VARFYPEVTSSFRAWVGEVDGEPRGIAGIAYTRPYASLFSYRPFLRRYAVWRLIRRIMDTYQHEGLPVRAIAEPGEDLSPGLLRKMGFNRIAETDVGVLYEWRSS
jgi:hypothetical protein